LGLDRDDAALLAAQQRLCRFGARLITRQASYTAAQKLLDQLGWRGVDGAILDLGVSSWQLDTPVRGFSFRASGRLDMRMDRRQELDAERIVNTYGEGELERILRDYGEETEARRIAQAIVAERKINRFATTDALAELVVRIKKSRQRDRHPATRVFQALRIAVNQELAELERFLDNGYELLLPEGRMVVISFHSLEDRLVKTAFRKWSRACLCPPRTLRCQCGWSQKVKLLTKKPIVPLPSEIAANPRSRSAKMRAVERV
jgi:16S rRNA (cytosine1402-N4)-methyltransferase